MTFWLCSAQVCFQVSSKPLQATNTHIFHLFISVRIARDDARQLADACRTVPPRPAHSLHPRLLPTLRLHRQNAVQTPRKYEQRVSSCVSYLKGCSQRALMQVFRPTRWAVTARASTTSTKHCSSSTTNQRTSSSSRTSSKFRICPKSVSFNHVCIHVQCS